MKTTACLCFSIAWLTAASLATASNGDASFEDFEELDLESLLSQVVTTASRHEQRLSDTPVSTTVLTAEDIRASGATTIPDALREVPGLDIMASTMTGVNVSARGLNELAANTMMVLIDGRSVYAEFYGIVLWEHLPITLDEIDRIEVTRSPGSALYGANAFAGVINIITRAPEDLPQASARTTASEYGGLLTNFIHSGSQGSMTYKVSGGWRRVEGSDRPGDSRRNLPRFDARARYDLESGATLNISGGRAQGVTSFFPTSLSERVSFDGTTGYARADYERDNWSVRSYWNNVTLGVEPDANDIFNPVTGLRTDSIDLELQHASQPGEDHYLIWTANYRHNFVDWSIVEQDYTQNLFALSVYDEWRPYEQLSLSLGVRYDHHPLVDSHVSPRASLVYRPAELHTLRASWGQAHRNPTYIESYFDFGTVLPEVPALPIMVSGNQALDSEMIQSIEIGYQGKIAPALLGSADLFYNQIRDIVEIQPVDYHDVPPAPFPGLPSRLSFVNVRDQNAVGGELALDWTPHPVFRSRASYAFVDLSDAQTRERGGQAPAHKLHFRVDLKATSKLRVHVATRFVAGTEWLVNESWGFVERSTADFWTTDLNLRYSLVPSHLDLALGVRNLFDERYYEYVGGDAARSQIYATTNVRF